MQLLHSGYPRACKTSLVEVSRNSSQPYFRIMYLKMYLDYNLILLQRIEPNPIVLETMEYNAKLLISLKAENVCYMKSRTMVTMATGIKHCVPLYLWHQDTNTNFESRLLNIKCLRNIFIVPFSILHLTISCMQRTLK
jgi:hypothetical protein